MLPDITNTLAVYIAKQILRQHDRVIAPSEGLISGGLVDSLHLIDLSIFIEDTFGVYIDDTELNLQTFDTLAQLAELVQMRLITA